MSEKRPEGEAGDGAEGLEDNSENVVERLESLLDEEEMGGGEVEQELFDVEAEQSGQRLSRAERRQRDLQEYRNLEGVLRHGPVTVQVSEDGLIARITRIDHQTTHNSVMALMQRHRVSFGINLGAIQDALIKAGRGEILYDVVVAKGLPPKVLGEPKIHYREGLELGAATFKRLNQLLQAPARAGIPGIDVMGEELPAPPPVNIEVMTDPRVYAEEQDGKMGFYAETGGGVTQLIEKQVGQNRRHRRIRIGISPISSIDGDVDYSTDNIDFNGDVIIRDSVQSLFSVKATGTVNIGGDV